MHRQSALATPLTPPTSTPLGGLTRAALELLGVIGDASGHIDVLLQPGDVLYLPPFYAHHVTSDSNISIAVAVWSDSDAANAKDALEQLPLPWEADWSPAERTLAAALYVRALLVDSHHGSERAAAAFVGQLLSQRYAPLLAEEVDDEALRTDVAELSGLRAACERLRGAAATQTSSARAEELRVHVAGGAARVAKAVLAVSNDRAIVDVALGNYLEAVAHFVVGRSQIHGFLTVCVHEGFG